MSDILNWFVDTMARTETLDLYFVVSDLIDIPVSEEDLAENNYYDTMTEDMVATAKRKNVPLGKLVI